MRALVWTASLLGISACTSLHQEVRSEGQRPISQLRASPSEFTLDGRTVRFSTYAWLNLQPGGFGSEVERTWSPLHFFILLSPTDSLPIVSPVHIEEMFLLGGDSSFTAFRQSTRLAPGEYAANGWPPQTIAYQISGGPWWAMRADSVDVVIRIRTHGSDRSQFVRAPRVVLHRVS